MRGQWGRFLTSLPLRFVLTGFIFYMLVNIQGAQQAIQPFNVFIHFTYFTVGHAHLALLGGFTILGMGVIYYCCRTCSTSHPTRGRSPSGSTGWSRGASSLFFIAMTIGGFVQGQSWLNGQCPRSTSCRCCSLWNMVRGVAGVMIYASAWIQGYNISAYCQRHRRVHGMAQADAGTILAVRAGKRREGARRP